MKSIDCIINARYIVPVVPSGLVHEDYAVAIDDGEIVALDTQAAMADRFTANRVVDLPDHALAPGLVNTHTHAAMSLMRGYGDDLALMPWLETRIWPLESEHVSESFVRDGTHHAFAEMIRGGTTCANDMYFFPEAAIETASDVGIRYVAGMPILEFPTNWGRGPADYLARSAAVLSEVADRKLISATCSPHAPYTVSDDTFIKTRELIERFGVKMDVHIHETQGEVDRSVDEYGQRPIARLLDLGVFDDQLIAVHMTALTDDEIALCADRGVAVVHCPESNLKLASGFAPIAKLLAAGATVAIGTDGAASNNDLDMISETRSAALLAKAVAQDATACPASIALEMATLGGAKALGLADRIGSIELGKQADLMAVNFAELELTPVYDPISHLVYSADRHQVTDVWVAGHQLMQQRELTTIDMEALLANVQHWQRRVAQT